MPDKSSTVSAIGPTDTLLLLSAVEQSWLFTMSGRTNGQIQLIADDPAISWFLATVAGGPYKLVPAGGVENFPIYQSATLYLLQNGSAVNIRSETVG